MKEPRTSTLRHIRFQKRLSVGLLVIGVLAIAAAVPFFMEARRFSASAVHAPGKIVELDRQQSGKDVSYFPVFSFVDQSGRTHVIRSRIDSKFTSYAVGDAIEVLYLADDPDSAKLNNFFSIWFWPLFFGVVGFALFIVGIVFWRGAASWMAMVSVDAGRKH